VVCKRTAGCLKARATLNQLQGVAGEAVLACCVNDLVTLTAKSLAQVG
jgi:phosphoribosylaminoimidazole (AIR) synthetase